jgi:hypothetical protein
MISELTASQFEVASFTWKLLDGVAVVLGSTFNAEKTSVKAVPGLFLRSYHDTLISPVPEA